MRFVSTYNVFIKKIYKNTEGERSTDLEPV